MIVLALLLGAAAASSAAAGRTHDPLLRGAAVAKGHVVVAFVPGELIPGEIEVSTTRRRAADGSFDRRGVRLRERIVARLDPASGVARFRTVAAVAPGVYFVAVSGFIGEPPADCLPVKARCGERWSNVLRISVPKPNRA